MKGNEQLDNWSQVLYGMNEAKSSIMHLGPRYVSDNLLQGLSRFYTGLSVIETAHLDDISDHYSNN